MRCSCGVAARSAGASAFWHQHAVDDMDDAVRALDVGLRHLGATHGHTAVARLRAVFQGRALYGAPCAATSRMACPTRPGGGGTLAGWPASCCPRARSAPLGALALAEQDITLNVLAPCFRVIAALTPPHMIVTAWLERTDTGDAQEA